jgi:hypothetical protein
MLSLVALLSIIVVFLLIELNRDTELDDFAKRMIQFHEGIELENEVMRWLLAHPKEPISAKKLGKELDRPVDHVRSALERLGVPENSGTSKSKHEVIHMQAAEKEKHIEESGSNSPGHLSGASECESYRETLGSIHLRS